jgi:hypothetical protein
LEIVFLFIEKEVMIYQTVNVEHDVATFEIRGTFPRGVAQTSSTIWAFVWLLKR